jgi:hypothetical protein
MSATRAAFLESGRRVRATVAPQARRQLRLLLMAQLAQIADAGACDPGICNGPARDIAAPFARTGYHCRFYPEL